MPNENDLGRWAVLAGLTSFGHTLRVGVRRRLPSLAIWVLALVVAWETESAQARTVLIVLSLALIGVMRLARTVLFQRHLVALVGVTTMIVSGFLVASWASLLNWFGEDVDLSNRVPLWGFVLGSIAERPLLGYGIGGYWNSSLPQSDGIVFAVGFRAFQAHNSYLDWWLQLGALGVFLLSAFVFVLIVELLRKASVEPGGPSLSLAFVASMIAIYGSTATMIAAGRVEWLFVLTMVSGALRDRTFPKGNIHV